ncbi:MAG TPA: helix-turn-helix transcriptional regulator [Mycobacteriales bacterium]|nr:helix-turn-helix transcriptional regulator [Mycobacteriales bacterium]
MSETGPPLKDVIKRRRLELGWTQQQLANRAGTSIATIASLETGRTKEPYKLREIFRVLGLDWVEDRSPPLLDATDEELVREVGRRLGHAAELEMRGYLGRKRTIQAEHTDSISQDDNDVASA